MHSTLTLTLVSRFPNPTPAETPLSGLSPSGLSSTSQFGGGNLLLGLPPLVTVSHFRLTSLDNPELCPGNDPWPVKVPSRLPRWGPLTPIPLPRFKFFIVLYQQRFPRPFLESSQAYSYR